MLAHIDIDLSLLHVTIHRDKHMCGIDENFQFSFICSLPDANTLLPLLFHLPSPFPLSPIYFGFPLLPSLCLSHKWPSMVFSFLLFLVGRYGMFAPHHWSLIAFDLLLTWLKNSVFFLFLQEKGKIGIVDPTQEHLNVLLMDPHWPCRYTPNI